MMSDFIKVVEGSSKELLVSFSHINTARGKFSYFNVLSRLPYSVIHVNCPDNNFFLNEIPGVGGSVLEVANFLSKQISALKPTKVTFFGNSMGAYGALLYGIIMNVDLIVSLGPEPVLGLKGSPAAANTRDYSILQNWYAKNLLGLPHPKNTKLIALFGEKASADMFGALKLKDKFVAGCYSIKNAFHSLSPFIEGFYGLDKFLHEIIVNGQECEFIKRFAGDLLDFPCVVEALYKSTYFTCSEELFDHLIQNLPQFSSQETKSYVYSSYAKYLINKGRMSEALLFANKTLIVNTKDIEAINLYLENFDATSLIDLLSEDYCKELLNGYRFHGHEPCRFMSLISYHFPSRFAKLRDSLPSPLTSKRREADVNHHLGNLLFKEGDLAAAEQAQRQAIAMDPNVPDFHRALSLILERQQKLPEAMAEVKRAAELSPSNPHLLHHLGNLLFKQGDLAAAERAQQQAIALDPKAAGFRRALSSVLERQQRLPEAVAEARCAAELSPRNPHLLHRLGNLLFKEGNLTGAEQAQRQAIAINPKVADFHRALGLVLERQQRLPEAVAEAKRAAELSPSNPHLFHHLGNLLLKVGDLEAAEQAQRQAIGLDPNIAGFHRALTSILERQQSLKEEAASVRAHAVQPDIAA